MVKLNGEEGRRGRMLRFKHTAYVLGNGRDGRAALPSAASFVDLFLLSTRLYPALSSTTSIGQTGLSNLSWRVTDRLVHTYVKSD